MRCDFGLPRCWRQSEIQQWLSLPCLIQVQAENTGYNNHKTRLVHHNYFANLLVETGRAGVRAVVHDPLGH